MSAKAVEFVEMIARLQKPNVAPDDDMPGDDRLCDCFTTLMQLIDWARTIQAEGNISPPITVVV